MTSTRAPKAPKARSMYANEKHSWDELKQPGDWMRTSIQREEGGVRVPYGLVIICTCNATISLSREKHSFESLDPLTISPSIGHVENGIMKCHYFIKQGELIAA
jgi:uncharacterized protein DUF6527